MGESLYQLVPILRAKDAVGRMGLGLLQVAEMLGYHSLVYTERQRSLGLGRWWWGPVRKGLLSERPWAGEAQPDISLYHHSMGTNVADRFIHWPARKKVLVYHNITPPHLLEETGPQAAKDARWGLEQMKSLLDVSDVQIGLSDFSCQELKGMGARHVVQLPYCLWNREPTQRARSAARSAIPSILVVGRVEPHKRVLESVRGFRALTDRGIQAKLRVIGNTRANPSYVASIRQFIREAGLDKEVKILGRVPDDKLESLYAKASALLTLSEHEGFCVPIVEAMRWGVPIVAFRTGAIPETLGKGGLLVEDRDPQRVADSLQTLLENQELVGQLREAQMGELKRYSFDAFATGFGSVLSEI